MPAEDALTRFERANSEFEDLPAGAYLAELRVGRANVVWGAVNVALTAAIAISWALGAIGPEPVAAGRGSDGAMVDPHSPWWLQARIAWTLLPFSSLCLGIVTLWQSEVSRNSSRARTIGSLVLAIAGGAAWFIAGHWLGIEFVEAR